MSTVAHPAAGQASSLPIDPATELAGIRVNIWVSAVMVVPALMSLVVRARRRPPELADAYLSQS